MVAAVAAAAALGATQFMAPAAFAVDQSANGGAGGFGGTGGFALSIGGDANARGGNANGGNGGTNFNLCFITGTC